MIGAPAPSIFIKEKLKAGRFIIAGGTPGAEISWQVTGIRKDPFANANRIQVEVDKPAEERGLYAYPRAYGLPASRGIESLHRIDRAER